MKVGKRLGLGFALVFVLLIAVTALGISGMSLIQDRLENIVNVSNKQSRMILDMRAIVYDRQVSLRNLTLLTDLDDMAKDLKKIEKQSKDYSELEAKLLDSLKRDPNFNKDEKDLLAKLYAKLSLTAKPAANTQLIENADNNQKITISTDTTDFVKYLKSVNSKENEDFFTYIKFFSAKNKEYSDEPECIHVCHQICLF